MIIIEGPDNSGKTTLVNFLMEHMFNAYIYRSPGPPQGGSKQQCIDMEDMLYTHRETRTICDRIPCISEAVYGPVIRGSNGLKDKGFVRRIIAMKTLIVFCRPPIEVITSLPHPGREEEDPQHIASVADHQAQLIGGYDEVFKNIPHIHYDWTTAGPDFLSLLMTHIELYWSITNRKD